MSHVLSILFYLPQYCTEYIVFDVDIYPSFRMSVCLSEISRELKFPSASGAFLLEFSTLKKEAIHFSETSVYKLHGIYPSFRFSDCLE